jgi:uncharacterized protein YbjT (DUF2867 family)
MMQTENRSQRIAVTGATGRVGSPLVEILEQRGHAVVAIARSTGVDVVSGDGLDEALAGAETIVDTATGPSPDERAATEFFSALARNLQRAGAAAGAKRIVVVSIIGIDKFQSGYNAAKMAQEKALLEGPLPVRIVRAAQFHEFVEPLVGWTIHDGVAEVPEMRSQLVAARVVAEALADAAEEPEIENGRITEVAGPLAERLADAAAVLSASRGESIEIRESRGGLLAEPDSPDAAAYAEGAALPNLARSSPGPASKSGSRRPRRSSSPPPHLGRLSSWLPRDSGLSAACAGCASCGESGDRSGGRWRAE